MSQSHLSLTQWNVSNSLAFTIWVNPKLLLEVMFMLAITPELNFIWKGGDLSSIWKLKAHYFTRYLIWILSHSYFRSLPLWSPNPGNKPLVLVWCLKLNRILLMPFSIQIFNPLGDLSDMLALLSMSLILLMLLLCFDNVIVVTLFCFDNENVQAK